MTEFSTERERLCVHVRNLIGIPMFAEAMAIADAIHLDGIGSMQAALDAVGEYKGSLRKSA